MSEKPSGEKSRSKADMLDRIIEQRDEIQRLRVALERIDSLAKQSEEADEGGSALRATYFEVIKVAREALQEGE